MTISVTDAAHYLGELSGWKISNLAMQKIIYMADMNFVGITGVRLVDEDFEAWDYGPVLPSLYHRCKAFGAKPVPDIFWDAEDISGSREGKMLKTAWDALKGRTPGQLVSNTHRRNGAWAKRYVAGASGEKISSEDMIEEYKNRRYAKTGEPAAT
jgi:uncharacterized phage-associated protein